jgi:hypothetical protein
VHADCGWIGASLLHPRVQISHSPVEVVESLLRKVGRLYEPVLIALLSGALPSPVARPEELLAELTHDNLEPQLPDDHQRVF